MVDIEVDTVVDIEVDTVVDRVVDTEVDKVVDKVVDTEVDMVDTRVDRVVDMMVDIEVDTVVDIEVDKVVDTGCSNRAAPAACTDTAYGTAYSTEAAYNTAYSNTAEADTVVDMVVDRGLDTVVDRELDRACSTGVSACSRSAPAWAASHSRGWCSRGWNNSGSCSKDLYRSRCSPPPTTPPAYTEHKHQLGLYSFTSDGETFGSRGGLITRFDLDSTAVRLLIKGH